jgi:hypothetical protein
VEEIRSHGYLGRVSIEFIVEASGGVRDCKVVEPDVASVEGDLQEKLLQFCKAIEERHYEPRGTELLVNESIGSPHLSR